MNDIQKRQRGRPELPDNEKAKTRAIRLTDERWEKLKRLGMTWLSRAIDRAKEPTESK